MADHLLFGDLITGGHVKVDIEKNNMKFDIIAAKPRSKNDQAKESSKPGVPVTSYRSAIKKREPVKS